MTLVPFLHLTLPSLGSNKLLTSFKEPVLKHLSGAIYLFPLETLMILLEKDRSQQIKALWPKLADPF